MGLTRQQRVRLIERVIEATAEQLGVELEYSDRYAILARFSKKGRPSKDTPEAARARREEAERSRQRAKERAQREREQEIIEKAARKAAALVPQRKNNLRG